MGADADAWRTLLRRSTVLIAALLTADWRDLRPQYVLTDWQGRPGSLALADASDIAVVTRVSTVLWFIDLLAGHGLPVDLRATVLLHERPDLARTLFEAGPRYAAQLMASGTPPKQAMQRGFDRLALAASNYMDSVSKDELQRVIGENNAYVQGYRREAKPTSCGFCRRLAARTNPNLPGSIIYNVTERWAKPHLNCRCVLLPQPIFRVRRTLSRNELAAVRDLKQALIVRRDAALRDAADRHDIRAA